MSYTYSIGENTTAEDFKELCRRIDELCPGYERADGEGNGDGAEKVRWEKGRFVITAEWETSSGAVTVCSGERLPAFEKERFWEKFDLENVFSQASGRVKFGFLLLFFIIYTAVLAVLFWGNEYVIWTLPAIVMVMAYCAVTFGWAWVIPGGLAAAFMADRKSSFGVRFIMVFLPVMGVAYGCRWFGFNSVVTDAVEMSGSLEILFLPPLVYFASLPYLITDEAACRRLARSSGRRPRGRQGVCCIAVSLLLSAGVMGLAHMTDRDSDRYLYDLKAELALREREAYYGYCTELCSLIDQRYGGDLKAIAGYSIENNCGSWRECPDESMVRQWQGIFAGGVSDYEIRQGSGYITMKVMGIYCDVSPDSITPSERNVDIWIK